MASGPAPRESRFLSARWRDVYQDTTHPDQQWTLFGQLGIGDPRVNRFAYYTGGVLAFSALIPGRNQDEFGIAVATLELT
jgi:hypothetical protein